ncbi:hypothetical protein CROQUDRAFT_49916, partial [Cronartium quercuum f. sp. fusiforme G11]
IWFGIYHLFFKFLNWFWVPINQTNSIRSNPNQRNNYSRWLNFHSKKIGLNKKSFVCCIILLLIGIYELIKKNHTLEQEEGIRGKKIRQNDEIIKKPFDYLFYQNLLPDSLDDKTSLKLNGKWIKPRIQSQFGLDRGNINQDVTAIILNWNRLDNLIVIVTHLCRYDFFNSIMIWNNNYNNRLKKEDFVKTECPDHKLLIVNSPTNLYFFSRYLACIQSITKFCFFQDDDNIVIPIRTMYKSFLINQNTLNKVIVQADPIYNVMYNWEWCFKDVENRLKTCFAWLGHGSFISKETVQRFLNLVSTISIKADSLALADNFFSTSFNQKPLIIVSNRIHSLPSPSNGFSDGDKGLERNRIYIQKGVEELSKILTSSSPKFDNLLPNVNEEKEKEIIKYIRSTNSLDTYSFITNVENFPTELPINWSTYNNSINLSDWENQLGRTGKRLNNQKLKKGKRIKERNGIWGIGEKWVIRFPYSAAVDQDLETAWRSIDAISKDDFIGINFIDEIPLPIQKLTINLMIDNSFEMLNEISIEILIDDYSRWIPVSSTGFICTPINRKSNLSPFPDLEELSERARIKLDQWKTNKSRFGLYENFKRWIFGDIVEQEDEEDDEDEEEEELMKLIDEDQDHEIIQTSNCSSIILINESDVVELNGFFGLRLVSLVDQSFGWTVWDINLSMD